MGVASRGPPSRAYNLRHVTIIIRKWLPNMVKLSGVLDSAHSREDTNILSLHRESTDSLILLLLLTRFLSNDFTRNWLK